MASLMVWRGPDGQGEWVDKEAQVGLVHRRLAIIDLSPRGAQPMWDARRRAVISFNGEIYNYRELRRELEAEGFQFNSDCDTEVILNLYLRDGRACLPRLNGIFAFALWDPAKQELFLARDGFGIKPLYYAETRRGFIFGSELKSLLEVDGVDREIDAAAVASYITFLYSPSPRTLLKAVKKLQPGHAMVVTRSGVQEHRKFFKLPYDQPISRMSVEEAVAQTQHYIRQAVARQMIADVPVGAFLSGGLDSSSVVAFAREHMRDRKFSCFTIAFDGAESGAEGMADDLPYARRVAAHLGVDLQIVRVSPGMAVDLEQMVYQLDEPQADPAALNTYYISRLARENGMKVLLSGTGGDDIFTGYRRHRALMLERYWSWLPGPLRDLLRQGTSALPRQNPTLRRLAKAFQFADRDGDDRIVGYFQWIAPELRRSLLNPATAWPDPAQLMREGLTAIPDTTPSLNRMLYLDAKYFLTDHNLNYTDKMAMAAGVEVRVPLLDPDLVSFAARLPLEYKQRGATGKWIFKKAMEPYLPRDVIYRPKTGFGAPLRRWLGGKFGEAISDYLSPDSLRRRGLFDPAGVAKLMADDRAGRIDAAYPILALACVEIWCRRFIDQRAVQS